MTAQSSHAQSELKLREMTEEPTEERRKVRHRLEKRPGFHLFVSWKLPELVLH